MHVFTVVGSTAAAAATGPQGAQCVHPTLPQPGAELRTAAPAAAASGQSAAAGALPLLLLC
jgi:hypothetical protein